MGNAARKRALLRSTVRIVRKRKGRGSAMSRTSENVIRFFQASSPEPRPWGIYHFFCLGILGILIAVIAACGKRLRKNPKIVRGLTAGLGAVLLVSEILKQIFSSVRIADGAIDWDYPWHIFPFQLCSTPLYVCIALFFLREGRVRRALCCYLGTFGIVGGAVVMAAPESVYITSLFINIHTMLWHMGLILLGVLQWCGGAIRPEAADWIGSVFVFLLFVITAFLLNLLLPQYADENFNMFYISPYVSPSSSPIFEFVWNNVPYPLYLVCYIAGFILISGLIFALLRIPLRRAYRKTEAQNEIAP